MVNFADSQYLSKDVCAVVWCDYGSTEDSEFCDERKLTQREDPRQP